MEASPKLPISQKRTARREAYHNAGIWSLGNGLAGTLVVIHFAYELDAHRIGLGISLILAAPQLIGVLRLFTPLISGRLVSRKLFCVCTFLIAAVLLALLPVLAKPGRDADGRDVADDFGYAVGALSPISIFWHCRALDVAGRPGATTDSRPIYRATRAVARRGPGDCPAGGRDRHAFFGARPTTASPAGCPISFSPSVGPRS